MENKCKERSGEEAAADWTDVPFTSPSLPQCLYTDTQRTAEGVKSMEQTSAAAPQPHPQPLKQGCKSRVLSEKKKKEIKSQTHNLVDGDLERLMAGSECRGHVSNQGLVELQLMTANPVRGSRAAALERSAPFGPLIKSSTWKLSQPTRWSLVVLKKP